MIKRPDIKCKYCNSESMIPIIYGYPSKEMLYLNSLNLLELGGCVLEGDEPYWKCLACQKTIKINTEKEERLYFKYLKYLEKSYIQIIEQ